MKGKSPLERPLHPKGAAREVSAAAFAYLFSWAVQDAQAKSSRVPELEERLASLGAHVGVRLAELLPARVRPGRRETSVVAMLSFIVTVAWKTLFGRQADNLEKSLDSPLEYLLVDTGPNVGAYTSLPKVTHPLFLLFFVCVGLIHLKNNRAWRHSLSQLLLLESSVACWKQVVLVSTLSRLIMLLNLPRAL